LSDFSDFLRKAEDDINKDKKSAQLASEQKLAEAQLLSQLLAIEWVELIRIMKSITKDETFDGKQFFWISDRSVMLGDVTLISVAMRDRGKEIYQARYQSVALGPRPRNMALIPTLELDVVRWTVSELKGTAKLSTSELAIALLKQLVDYYRAIQSPQ